METITSPETFLKEQESDVEIAILHTHEERQQAREELAEIFDIAFIDDPVIQKSGVNFIRDIPDQMYYNPDTLIVIAKDEDSGVIQGFSFMEKRDNNTYYANVTAVRRRNQGYGSKIIAAQDEILRQKGIGFIVTHVDKDKGLYNMLQEQYQAVEPTPEDKQGALPHQETLRLKI